MRILVLTHLFPNQGNPNHGIFAARQLYEIRRQGAEIEVLVPMVWRPPLLGCFKRWQVYNHRWKCEYKDINANPVPYLRLPGKWFRPWAHWSVFYAIRQRVIQLHREKPFDVIYARFLHPEGYAAMKLATILRVPAVSKYLSL
jgi:teichuronic acid biosynthesis glycosyltransferase TuaC